MISYLPRGHAEDMAVKLRAARSGDRKYDSAKRAWVSMNWGPTGDKSFCLRQSAGGPGTDAFAAPAGLYASWEEVSALPTALSR